MGLLPSNFLGENHFVPRLFVPIILPFMTDRNKGFSRCARIQEHFLFADFLWGAGEEIPQGCAPTKWKMNPRKHREEMLSGDQNIQ